MKDYILFYRNDGFWLVGPFADEASACAWARTDGANPYDDPRWQSITLDNSRVNGMPILLPPEEHVKKLSASTNTTNMPESV